MPQTVLVIDDTPAIHALLRARLKWEGVALAHATDADAGFELARSSPPDLILLDVEMPGTDGFELCRRLKAEPATALVPVVFLTAASSVETKVRGFELGAIDYVTKPFEPAELQARVRAALRTKRFQDMLASRAQIDGLTGIWNRAHFDRRLSDELAAARRYGRLVSLVMLDIDHFKRINDTHGHPFGDRVLTHVGETLTTLLRQTDAACRYGGEEFGLILPETGLDAAVAAERVAAAIRALELLHKGTRVDVTASFGVASTEQLPPASLSVGLVVSRADAALYEAKRAGRDQVRRAA